VSSLDNIKLILEQQNGLDNCQSNNIRICSLFQVIVFIFRQDYNYVS